MIGGKHKKRIRNTTPAAFRDLLLDMARSVTVLKADQPPHSVNRAIALAGTIRAIAK